MANQAITLISALYGGPGHQIIDVSRQTEQLLDAQYKQGTTQFTLGPISPDYFDLPNDPAPDVLKTYTILYSVGGSPDGRQFMRGGHDGDTIVLTVAPPRAITIASAIYATNTMGLDVTTRLSDYVADPGNSLDLAIGSQDFFNALTGCLDPAPWALKSFSAVYTVDPSTTPMAVCGLDGQTVTLASPASGRR